MKRFLSSTRFLALYSGALTIVFALTVLAAFARQNRKVSFEEIDVQRVNVVEPDGTVRMVISDKARFPGIIIKRQERPHPDRKAAGMLFFNDEGTENGGLTFGGEKDESGRALSSGHLSFDQYEQDQTLALDAQQTGDRRWTAIRIVDRPDYPISDLIDMAERTRQMPAERREAEMRKFQAAHPGAHDRLYLGRTVDRAVGLRLKDTEGRDRVVIEVGADGTPVLRFLDAQGKVTSEWPPKTGAR